MSIREDLKELSEKIAEVFEYLGLTEIPEDLKEDINDYWSLVRELATCVKGRDEERQAKEQAERVVEERMTRLPEGLKEGF